MVRKASNKFLPWLDEKLQQKGWSDHQLAKRAGISHSVISKARNSLQPPGWEACAAIAKALNLPQAEVLIVAGWLPEPPNYSSERDEWMALYDILTPEQRQKLKEIGEVIRK